MAKKTVLTKTVDGYELVAGFSDAQIDPVATWSKIQDTITASDENAHVTSIKQDIAVQLAVEQTAVTLMNSAADANDQVLYNTQKAAYDTAAAKIATLEVTLAAALSALDTFRTELFNSNATYFTPGKNESILSDSDYTALKKTYDALTGNQVLCVTGAVVADYRNTTYWTKTGGSWTSTTISTLGVSVPSGSIVEVDLTSAQKTEISDQTETARIAALSDADKLTESTAKKTAAKTAAANMYTEEIISGTDSAAALSDSQASYKTALAEINKLYGTSLT
jgi:hypothetical protein